MKKFLLFILLTLLPLVFSSKCRVLSLAGGGDKGAFTVGAFSALASLLPSEDVQYDVIVGVSVGSINGSLIALSAKGEELSVAAELEQLWGLMKGRASVWQHWTASFLQSINESSFLDSQPLKEMLERNIRDRKFHRGFIVGVANINTGKYESLELSSDIYTSEEALEGVLASSAVEVLFNNRYLKDEIYGDGNLIHTIDLFSGVNYCLRQGFKEENVILDVIGLDQAFEFEKMPQKRSIWTILARGLNIVLGKNSRQELKDFKRTFPKVELRHVIYPKTLLPNSNMPLWFDQELIQKNIRQGYEDAKEILIGKSIK